MTWTALMCILNWSQKYIELKKINFDQNLIENFKSDYLQGGLVEEAKDSQIEIFFSNRSVFTFLRVVILTFWVTGSSWLFCRNELSCLPHKNQNKSVINRNNCFSYLRLLCSVSRSFDAGGLKISFSWSLLAPGFHILNWIRSH